MMSSAARLLVIALAVLAVCYNGLLAIVNAHGIAMNFFVVAAAEGLLLAVGLAVVMGSGLRRSDLISFALLAAIAIVALGESIANGLIYPDPVRNFAIIAVFTMLGARCDARLVRTAFLISSALVLVFLVLEIATLSAYVALFQPASYLENTRGLTQATFNDTGLFGNALGFEGRFSFGLFNTPRTSSLFLEQVSLGSYSAVLCIYLLSFWKRTTVFEKALHIILIFLILTSSNTRLSSILALLSIFGYIVYPILPTYSNAAIAPLALVGAASALPQLPPSAGDDLIGRLTVTISALSRMDVSVLAGGAVLRAKHFADSGYAYVIYSTSIFGMIALWLYVVIIVPQCDDERRRCAWALNIYLFSWLLVSGTAVFSLKVACLLWLLVGFERRARADGPIEADPRSLRTNSQPMAADAVAV